MLYKFAWGPIATALDQREQTIARQIEEARLASEKAAMQLQEYEARLAAATEEARQIVGQARKDAELAKDKIVAEARDAAAEGARPGRGRHHVAKNQALDEIAQKSVQTAVSLASNIIRREVKPQEHEALIGEAHQRVFEVELERASQWRSDRRHSTCPITLQARRHRRGRQHLGTVYAKALLGAAEKAGQADQVVEELESLVSDVLDKLPQLEEALAIAAADARRAAADPRQGVRRQDVADDADTF